MNQTLRYVFGAVALTGFVVSLVVHVNALLGVDLAASIPAVWLLHAGIFVVFAPFVFLSRKSLRRDRSWRFLRKGVPNWVAVLGGLIFVYAIVNFTLFMHHTEGGAPAVRNGRYVLLNHGALIRVLTASEYRAFGANELRGFSGHWLLFYFLSAAYFLLWKPAEPEQDSGTADEVS